MKHALKSLVLAGFALGLVSAASAAVETYTIDPVHSSVSFGIRHLVSKFTGSFTKVTGTIAYDAAAPEKSSVDATVDIASVSTANEKRENHLKSADFFDVAKYTTATFKSTAWKKTGENTFDVTGDLTIKGVTKPTTFNVTFLATGEGMGGTTISGWEATAKINRNDFGVSYGPKILGDEVTLTIGIEAGYKK